jgi:hypothetical protein
MTTKEEAAKVEYWANYWEHFAEKLGWKVYGFNYGDNAAFYASSSPDAALIELTRDEVENTLRHLHKEDKR